MDSIIFTTENNEYVIELCKERRYFSYSGSNYICHIKFYDFMQREILDVSTNENNMIHLMQLLSEDMYLYENMYRENYFTLDFDNDIHLLIFTSELPLIPQEEDPVIYFQFIESSNYTGNMNITRIFLEFSVDFKDKFVYQLYQLLSDIPNFDQLRLYGEYSNYMEDYNI